MIKALESNLYRIEDVSDEYSGLGELGVAYKVSIKETGASLILFEEELEEFLELIKKASDLM